MHICLVFILFLDLLYLFSNFILTKNIIHYFIVFYFFLGAIFTGATSQLALFLGLLLPILVYLFIINIKKIHNVKLLPLYVCHPYYFVLPTFEQKHMVLGILSNNYVKFLKTFQKLMLVLIWVKFVSFKQLLMDIPYEINIYVGYGPGEVHESCISNANSRYSDD